MPAPDHTCKGLECLIERWLATAGRPVNKREATDLRLLVSGCRLIRHDAGHWRYLVKPTPESAEFAVARTVLRQIIRRHGTPNLAAIRQLLYGNPHAVEGAYLEQLSADLLKANTPRREIPLACPVVAAPPQLGFGCGRH